VVIDNAFMLMAPVTEKHKRRHDSHFRTMQPRIALNSAGISAAVFPAMFQVNIDAVAANPTVFTNPNPTLANCQAKNDALIAKLARIEELKSELAVARVECAQCFREARAARGQLATYVTGVANGNAATMLLAGYDLAMPPGPPQPMPKVLNNAVTSSDNEGAALGEWAPVLGSKSYEVEIAAQANGPYAFYRVVTAARAEITGRPSGQKLWTRVRAVNSIGEGPWSDPACCMIG
jgi:hypothetical protein